MLARVPPIRWLAGLAWLLSWFTFSLLNPSTSTRVVAGPWPVFLGIRAAFAHVNHGISKDASALVSGMAIGDASALSPQLKAQMQQLSLTHLVAVSGANCAIVCGTVLLICARFGISRWLRTAVSLVSLVLYLGLVGPQPSVLRAAAMAGAVLVAKALGRSTAALDALSLAVLVLLALNPAQGANLGFALSVAATLGILVLAPHLSDRLSRRMPRWLALSVAVSMSAQLLCTPLLLGLQGGLPVWSILANLLAEPIVAPATIIGLTAVLLALPVPALAHALALVASVLTSITCLVASQASKLPLQLIPWPSGPIGQVAVIVAIVATLALVYRPKNPLATAAFTLALGLPILVGLRHTAVSAHWPARDWVIANCDVGQGDGLVIRSQGQVMVIDVGRDPAPIAACLQQLDVGEVSVLELTHFDLDHVGGVAGVLNGHKVEQVILTSFSDSRPGADATRRAVEAKGIPVTLAGIGVSGQLGEVSWRVISPTLGASEAEDANDGSIGMLLETPGFCLVTLADIGQPGQDRLLASRDSWFDPDCRNKPIVLKVGHHGSANQSSAFTQWLHPQIALISVGLGNRYGHPTPSCLEMLASVGAQIWRTDRQGALALSTSADGLTMTVAGRG